MKGVFGPLFAAVLLATLLAVSETRPRKHRGHGGFTDGDRTFLYVNNGRGKKLGCKVLYNSDTPDNSTDTSELLGVKNVSKEEMDFLVYLCHEKNGDFRNKVKRSFLIYPGTKWCGAGNNAQHDQDFGVHRETDACCREHDKCPHCVSGTSTAYGLYNPSPFTRVECVCDEKFYNCLKSSTDEAADDVGKLYFDFLGDTCLILTGETRCIATGFWNWLFSKCDQIGPAGKWGEFTKSFSD